MTQSRRLESASFAALGLSCALMFAPYSHGQSTISESKISARLEALSRINSSLYSQSPRIRELVNETAETLYQDPRLVELVQRFNLTDHNDALLEVARLNPTEASAISAVDYLLSSGAVETFTPISLKDPAVLTLLSQARSPKALDLLGPRLVSDEIDPKLRSSIVSELCLKKRSAQLLFDFVKTLEPAAKQHIVQAAVMALRQTPFTAIKGEFETLLPQSLQPSLDKTWEIDDLLKLSGNTESGQQVFEAAENTCINCHQVGDKGKDIGPALSEIGKKLGKDALFDAILNPSSGISFDYEGWNITLNSGDEVTGIVISKTNTHWTLKNLLGQIIEVPLEDIFEQQKMTQSLMPNGLGALLGKEKLVDLVAYLSTLGK